MSQYKQRIVEINSDISLLKETIIHINIFLPVYDRDDVLEKIRSDIFDLEKRKEKIDTIILLNLHII